MPDVSLVYFSATGVTRSLMQAVGEGLNAQGCHPTLRAIRSEDIQAGRYRNDDLMAELETSAAIVFGSPTYMGGPAAQFKAFIDATSDLWSEQRLAGKLAAGVTCGTSVNGDQSSTLQYFSTLASQHGMLWMGLDCPDDAENPMLNRLGSQMGVVAQTLSPEPHATDIATARYLGERLGRWLAK